MKTAIVRKKGQITLPVKMREALGLKENDVVTISQWGSNAIIIKPGKTRLDELLDESAKEFEEAGITLEEMLLELDRVRHEA